MGGGSFSLAWSQLSAGGHNAAQAGKGDGFADQCSRLPHVVSHGGAGTRGIPARGCRGRTCTLSGDSVERAYARSDVFEKGRLMMEAWASFLTCWKDNIVSLTGSR